MFKIYHSFDGECYTFKFYIHGFLVVSGSREVVKGGNKKKSGEISAPNIFMRSSLYRSTCKPYKEPNLTLWDEYLKSFWISEGTLIKWIDRLIKWNSRDMYYVKSLKELKNKIKDKQL